MRELAVTVSVVRRGAPDAATPFKLEATLTAPPGITCVLGRSGSGKSTLLAAVAGLIRPTRGRIAFGDEVWFDAARGIDVPAQHRRIAYVFQGLALFPHMDAIHNVTYGMPRAMPRAARRARAVELLRRLEVVHLARRRPRTFSGGEAQRVALARALARQPEVMLLDEPFSALDRDLRVQLARLVRTLVDEENLPLLFVTHNLGEARALADRVVRLEAGAIVERGTPAEILPRSGAVDAARAVASPDADDDAEGTPMPELAKRV